MFQNLHVIILAILFSRASLQNNTPHAFVSRRRSGRIVHAEKLHVLIFLNGVPGSLHNMGAGEGKGRDRGMRAKGEILVLRRND